MRWRRTGEALASRGQGDGRQAVGAREGRGTGLASPEATTESPDNSTPAARRGRKARSLSPQVAPGRQAEVEIVRLPNVTFARALHGLSRAVGGVPVRETADQMPISPTPPLRAPARLVTETRADVRAAALGHLAALAARGETRLEIDLGAVLQTDIGGIGILVLVQKRAREHGISTRLVRTPAAVRQLLTLTQLDYLFEFDE